MKTLAEVIGGWDAWANSACYDERNTDLQACIKEIKEACQCFTPPTYAQGQEEMSGRSVKILRQTRLGLTGAFVGKKAVKLEDVIFMLEMVEDAIRALPIKEGE